MEQVLVAIKTLQKEKPAVYVGGAIERLVLESKTPPLSPMELTQWEKEYQCLLPKSYKDFIVRYNGLLFYKGGGLQIFDFINAIEISKAHGTLSSKILMVGYSNNCDDFIYMDCKNKVGEMLYSLEGLGPLEKMHVCFETFLNTVISCGGFYFWRSHQLDLPTWDF